MTEPVSKEVRYTDLSPGSVNEEEDEVSKTTSRTITYRNQEAGIWEATGSKHFGLIFGGRKIPASRVIKLGDHAPVSFNPYTARWGEAREGENAYLCITFNFEGLGESGTFQNIRGVYLLEAKGRKAQAFYTIGDIRKIDKSSHR